MFFRFNADAESMSHNTYKKKQNFVHFPLNDLNMTEYMTKNQRSQNIRGSVYNLYAVSNHYGSMESGHYTAFCKSSVFQKWVDFFFSLSWGIFRLIETKENNQKL